MGCCTSCDGNGVSASSPETNGLCWDCRGTGHPHAPDPLCWVSEVKTRLNAWESATEEEIGPSWTETEMLMADLEQALIVIETVVNTVGHMYDLSKQGYLGDESSIWVEGMVSQIRSRINKTLELE